MTDKRLQTGSADVPPASVAAAGNVAWRSRGYLPHLDAPSAAQHVVFRLFDSLPADTRTELAGMKTADRVRAIDSALDRGHGKQYLADPAIAALVQTALLAFDGERYELSAWCIMPNHVHVLLVLNDGHSLDRIVHSWKSYTAKTCNSMLKRSGAFWAREYFDRLMRNDRHFVQTVGYIEANPVNAGLRDSVSDWQFSSAWSGRSLRTIDAPDLKEAGGTPALPPTAGLA